MSIESKQLVKNEFLKAREALDDFISNEHQFDLICQAGDIIVSAIQNSAKVISCGNGGSMCDAMHFAEELTGQYRHPRPSLPAISISDGSHLTCAGNDYGFENIFARFVEGMGNAGDVLLAISTSGNSANIVNAAKAAKNKSMKIIGLTGKDGGKLKELCDVEIRAPKTDYSDRVQEIHIKVIHALIFYIEQNI